MISNYPYFGLPNYLRYMNPEPYTRTATNSSMQYSSTPRKNKVESSKESFKYGMYPNYRFQNNEFHGNSRQSFPRNGPFGFSVNTNNDNKNNFSNNITSSAKNSCFDNRSEQLDSSPSNSCSQDRSFQDVQPIFNLMGINVYFDDVLIICILFFLYNEGVNDPYLFLVLVLLLMS